MNKAQGWRVTVMAIIIVAVLTIVAVAWLYRDYRDFAGAPLAQTAAHSIDIPRGATLRSIIAALRRRGVTHAPELYWRALAASMGVSDRLHAGEYALDAKLTPRTLLTRMAEGRVVQHMFTLVDGWTFAQVRAALAQAPKLRHTLQNLSDAQVAQRLGIDEPNPEGWLLPQTYAYVLGDSDLDVLRRAHAAMQRTLAADWAARAPGLPLRTPYQALILASIVEKESALASERPRIAGVFVRRLEIGMKLQTDPSVIYGLGAAYHGDITRKDLETDTAYNTYTRYGLPPTPICMPGAPALQAALHPAPGKALYFVARGNGTHQFSDTLQEQNQAVDKYILHRQP
ncbi:endolytic transglycosylase MltG [Metallibacterium sp.]|uniref:endolytic transglycosylase MltG n=1 Tax=Metallibacterium sp. TaxID=2940281 RepID=UPI00261A655C|nr:endolytic transglycosylase MltG [Metallibacterium sp.]